MVVHGRNERLSLVRRAAREGQQYDQFAVTDAEIMSHCGSSVFAAGDAAIALMRAFLRAEKAKTGFTVDQNSKDYKALAASGSSRLPYTIPEPRQLSAASTSRVRTNLGRIILNALSDAGYYIGDTVTFKFGNSTKIGQLRSISDDTGHCNVYPTAKNSFKVPACDILARDGKPIIAREIWSQMYSHVK